MITIHKPLSMWNPWSSWMGGRDPFADFFESFVEREYPPVNVLGSDTEMLVQFEAPGLDPDDIDVRVKDDTLVFKGERRAEKLEEGNSYLKEERASGQFARSFALPFKVDPDKVEAAYKDGILSVRLPRAREGIARRISISAK